MITWPVLTSPIYKYIYIDMRINQVLITSWKNWNQPTLTKKWTTQHWFELGYVHVEISLLCHAAWLQNHAWCQKSMWFSLVIKRNQPMLWCFVCMVAKQHTMTKNHTIKLIINKHWSLLQNHVVYAFNITTMITNATKFPCSKWSDKFYLLFLDLLIFFYLTKLSENLKKIKQC